MRNTRVLRGFVIYSVFRDLTLDFLAAGDGTSFEM